MSALLEVLEKSNQPIPSIVESQAARRSYLPNPLFRSGLALAGANNAYNSDEQFEDDGLLTAYEATTLKLFGTELVVLSACNSGRGVVRAGEGIFGLERALRAAGARYILVTLFPVDDRITRELMQLFYMNWLESGNLRGAFHQSLLKMRMNYQLPILWGGYVLVGP